MENLSGVGDVLIVAIFTGRRGPGKKEPAIGGAGSKLPQEIKHETAILFTTGPQPAPFPRFLVGSGVTYRPRLTSGASRVGQTSRTHFGNDLWWVLLPLVVRWVALVGGAIDDEVTALGLVAEEVEGFQGECEIVLDINHDAQRPFQSAHDALIQAPSSTRPCD